jgi:hypothetical protein
MLRQLFHKQAQLASLRRQSHRVSSQIEREAVDIAVEEPVFERVANATLFNKDNAVIRPFQKIAPSAKAGTAGCDGGWPPRTKRANNSSPADP